MLNHHGHCINYWECEQINTKWTEMSLNRFEEEDGYYQAITPSNIATGTFVQSAGHNADYLQDSIDGNESVHMMSMGSHLIQRTWFSLCRTLARSVDKH